MKNWLRKLLRLHSPSAHMLGRCWCQEGPVVEPMTEQEVWECIERSYWRNWGWVDNE